MVDANFFPETIFFVNKMLCSKTKAHYFVFPDLFSEFFSEILVISTNMGDFYQPLDVCLALQRTYFVELFVPRIYSNPVLVTKQTTLEKEGIIQRILLSLQKSI